MDKYVSRKIYHIILNKNLHENYQLNTIFSTTNHYKMLTVHVLYIVCVEHINLKL